VADHLGAKVGELRARVEAEEIEDRRHDVDMPYELGPSARETVALGGSQGRRGGVDPRGNVDLFVEHRAGVAELAVLAEGLAVIGRVEDDGSRAGGGGAKRAEKVGNGTILGVDGVLVVVEES